MAEQKNLITYEGFKKLEDELAYLKNVRRKEIAQMIKEAKAQGDLSENAEYDAAREEQGKMEARVLEINEILKNSTVVRPGTGASDSDEIVSFGNQVTFEEMDTHQTFTYTIVGTKEADILQGKMSNESPLGSALIDARIGQVVTVESASGEMKSYMIKDVKVPEDR